MELAVSTVGVVANNDEDDEAAPASAAADVDDVDDDAVINGCESHVCTADRT